MRVPLAMARECTSRAYCELILLSQCNCRSPHNLLAAAFLSLKLVLPFRAVLALIIVCLVRVANSPDGRNVRFDLSILFRLCKHPLIASNVII